MTFPDFRPSGVQWRSPLRCSASLRNDSAGDNIFISVQCDTFLHSNGSGTQNGGEKLLTGWIDGIIFQTCLHSPQIAVIQAYENNWTFQTKRLHFFFWKYIGPNHKRGMFFSYHCLKARLSPYTLCVWEYYYCNLLKDTCTVQSIIIWAVVRFMVLWLCTPAHWILNETMTMRLMSGPCLWNQAQPPKVLLRSLIKGLRQRVVNRPESKNQQTAVIQAKAKAKNRVQSRQCQKSDWQKYIGWSRRRGQ